MIAPRRTVAGAYSPGELVPVGCVTVGIARGIDGLVQQDIRSIRSKQHILAIPHRPDGVLDSVLAVEYVELCRLVAANIENGVFLRVVWEVLAAM